VVTKSSASRIPVMSINQCHQPVVHALGETAMFFGNLELWLEAAIWGLLAERDKQRQLMAQAITAEMSFDRKVHAFFSLYKLKYPSEADDTELKSLVAALFAVQDDRNAMLHSAWPFDLNGELLGRVKSSAKAKGKGGLRHVISSAEPDRITAVAKRIATVGQDLGRFCIQRIQARLPQDAG